MTETANASRIAGNLPMHPAFQFAYASCFAYASPSQSTAVTFHSYWHFKQKCHSEAPPLTHDVAPAHAWYAQCTRPGASRQGATHLVAVAVDCLSARGQVPASREPPTLLRLLLLASVHEARRQPAGTGSVLSCLANVGGPAEWRGRQ